MQPPRQGCSELSLLAIARILGIDADTVLYWTIAGRLQVGRCGQKTIISVDAAFTCTNPRPDEFLIITLPVKNAAQHVSPSPSGPVPGPRPRGRKP